MGFGTVQGSVARAIPAFNEGANEIISVMSTLCVDVSTTTLLLLARKNGRRITSADAATAVNIHRRHKEYATQRRLNVRLEEVRDHYVCEAGAQ